jgi:hypothetical protein
LRGTRNVIKSIAIVLMLLHPGASFGEESPVDLPRVDSPYPFTFQTSVVTRHFHPDPEHNNHQKLLNLEWNYKDDLLVGAAYFRNSFRQPTTLVYWGAKFRPMDSMPEAYIKVVAGLIHGYKGEYQDNIPFNQLGTAPAILPSVGYCYKQFCSELIVFGTAGAMLAAGVRF